MLHNISISKGNQTIKLGQSIDYNKIHAENEVNRLVPDLFNFLKKSLYEVKVRGLQLVSIYFDIPELGIQ